MGGAPPPRLAVREHIPLPPTMQPQLHIFSHFSIRPARRTGENPVAAGLSRHDGGGRRHGRGATDAAIPPAWERACSRSALACGTGARRTIASPSSPRGAAERTDALPVAATPAHPHPRRAPATDSAALAASSASRRCWCSCSHCSPAAAPRTRRHRTPTRRASCPPRPPLYAGAIVRPTGAPRRPRARPPGRRSPTRPTPTCACSRRCRRRAPRTLGFATTWRPGSGRTRACSSPRWPRRASLARRRSSRACWAAPRARARSRSARAARRARSCWTRATPARPLVPRLPGRRARRARDQLPGRRLRGDARRRRVRARRPLRRDRQRSGLHGVIDTALGGPGAGGVERATRSCSQAAPLGRARARLRQPHAGGSRRRLAAGGSAAGSAAAARRRHARRTSRSCPPRARSRLDADTLGSGRGQSGGLLAADPEAAAGPRRTAGRIVAGGRPRPRRQHARRRDVPGLQALASLATSLGGAGPEARRRTQRTACSTGSSRRCSVLGASSAAGAPRLRQLDGPRRHLRERHRPARTEGRRRRSPRTNAAPLARGRAPSSRRCCARPAPASQPASIPGTEAAVAVGLTGLPLDARHRRRPRRRRADASS